jgi:hypothetical protein
MKDELRPYTATPRFIAEDVRSGKMTSSEWRVYQWLRINANPYGISTTSISSIRDDIYPDVSINYINQLLLSLRSKKYLYYEDRQGHRGSFDVHFGDWRLPNGQIRQLSKSFGETGVRSEVASKDGSGSEPSAELASASQKLVEMKSGLAERLSADTPRSPVRSPHNDTDTENHNNDSLIKKSFEGGKTVREFEASTHAEARCQQIARELGEQYMNPILKILRVRGLLFVESVWGIVQEDIRAGKPIRNKGAYFQQIANNRASNKS